MVVDQPSQPINQAINQAINQSTNRPINQSINQAIKTIKIINRSIDQNATMGSSHPASLRTELGRAAADARRLDVPPHEHLVHIYLLGEGVEQEQHAWVVWYVYVARDDQVLVGSVHARSGQVTLLVAGSLARLHVRLRM
jgi:hypothetical protein